MPIKSGTLSDMLNRKDSEMDLFLSNRVVRDEPSTRSRDETRESFSYGNTVDISGL